MERVVLHFFFSLSLYDRGGLCSGAGVAVKHSSDVSNRAIKTYLCGSVKATPGVFAWLIQFLLAAVTAVNQTCAVDLTTT